MAVNQDNNFTKTRNALAALEFAKSMRTYADTAYDAVAPSNPSAQHALYNALEASRRALGDHLFALKQAHIDAQAIAGQAPAARHL